jgi:exopolysaccharide biosynthesis polyprenyl glycosylphosphotransferase
VESEGRTTNGQGTPQDEQRRSPAPEPLRVVQGTDDLKVVRDATDEVPATAGSAIIRPHRNVHINLLAFGLMLAGSDILCLAGALFLGDWLLTGTVGPVYIPIVMVIISAVLWVVVFNGYRLYAPHSLSAPDEFRRVISATSIGVLLLLVSAGTFTSLDRVAIGMTWFLVLIFELGTRALWRKLLTKWQNDSILTLRTLIVGTGTEARSLKHAISSENLGFLPIGHISVNGNGGTASLGNLEDLVETIRREGADCLLVASTEVDPNEMILIQRAARVAGVDLKVSANMPETLSTRLSLQPVGDHMAISMRPARLSGLQAAMKRSFDLVLASIGLILASPLIGALALAVKMTSPGPVFFTQERVTSGGRAFKMFKFRTMVQDADRLLAEQELDKSQAFFKLRSESATVTSAGRFMRKFSLDELPQLWNVLRGDMSLVGPRPLPVEQVAANLELLDYRHEVRAGLTGWWQINGRSDLDSEAAVRMDLFYIENWSLALDIYIIFRSIGTTLRGRGAY